MNRAMKGGVGRRGVTIVTPGDVMASVNVCMGGHAWRARATSGRGCQDGTYLYICRIRCRIERYPIAPGLERWALSVIET